MIYDLQCSVCGEQLNYRETRDDEGHLLILVEPCPNCSNEARDIEEYLELYGPDE